MDIILGFSRAKSTWKLGSKVIREVEKRDFSHAYIRYTCQITNVDIVAQASHGFVNQMNLDIFKQNNIIVKEYKISCSQNEFIDILTFINTNLGKDYSQLQLILIGIKKLIKMELDIDNKDKHFICSEFGARVCQVVKLPLNKLNLDYFTPSDLELLSNNLCVSHSHKIQLMEG